MEKIQINATNATMPLLMQAIWENIWKYTPEKSHTNATNVTMSLLMLFFFQITSRLVDRFMPNKCNDCDYASCRADDLKTHLKMHIGEKSNNCSQCKFASSHECNLRKPLRTHSGEKSNKCNQCDFASSYAHVLRRHLKMHSGVKQSTVKQLQPMWLCLLWPILA